MAFLTMIAPLVAMTYPIDKITDGKAQAFNSWLKEYLFNLMIQPLHLILYIVLVSSAWQLASENPIYALVSLGFMMPAEKLMRRFFGFEKAKTPGLLSGAAGAALGMTGLQKLFNHQPHKESSNGDKTKKDNIRVQNKSNINTAETVAGGKPTNSTANNSRNQQNAAGENKPEYDSRLTQEQRDELESQGIQPGDQEYDQALRGYGISTPLSNNEDEEEEEQGGQGGASLANSDNSDEGADLSTAGGTAPMTTEKKSPGQFKRILRATGAVAGYGARSLGKKVLNGVHPVRFLARLYGGTLGATMGLLLGVTSGDPTKALQYTGVGALTGDKFVKSFQGRDHSDLSRVAELSYYGGDYKEHIVDEKAKAIKRDDATITYIQQVTGANSRKEAKDILATTGDACVRQGVENPEDIATIHTLMQGEDAMTFEEAITARKYSKSRLPSNLEHMKPKDRQQYIQKFAEEFRDKGYDNPEELGERAFNWAIRYNDAQSNLTKNVPME